MDYIDWCHHILNIFEKEKYNQYLDEHELPPIIFGKEMAHTHDFHESDARMGMFDTFELLENAGLIEKKDYYWRISRLGKEVLKEPTEFWSNICRQELDSDEETLLKTVNALSPKISTNPLYGWLEEVFPEKFLPSFNINSEEDNDAQTDALQKYIYDLPELLNQYSFLQVDPMAGNHTSLKSTYQGLIWDKRRGFTVESRLIDELVKDWETTNVDFKREINLNTKEQKAEFAKDILGLASTKSSGKRYMIIGFDDKTREYFAPPNITVTQDRMENILSDLTDPIVNIRYEIVDFRQGKVGKLEIIREPEKLPYRGKKDVIIDAKGRKGLEKDKIYVRHGSHTESPSQIELEALEKEGERARGEN